MIPRDTRGRHPRSFGRFQPIAWLASEVLLPLGDRWNGNTMIPRLRFLRDAQWWDQPRIRAYQADALGKLIHVAYSEVPFYRALMDSARISPRDIVVPDDLYRLPVVTKGMLRKGYPESTSRPTGRRVSESATSGSTGENFRVLEDDRTVGWYRAAFLLSAEWSGHRIGLPHLQMGMNLSRSLDRRLKDALLRTHYFSAYDLSDAALDTVLDRLERNRIDYLWGYPGSIYYLARRASQRGWNRPLHSVVTWGDSLYPHYRKTIETSFAAKVYDTYGCAEGIQVAAQCGAGEGYHVHDFDTIVQYVDEDGQSAPAGLAANVVLTRLYPGPMPLIRYSVGDVALPGRSEPCPCGRSLSRMARIQGRSGDVVITPSGRRLIVHFFTGILEYFREIESFQIVQERIDRITLRVVPTGSYTVATEAAVIAALKEKGADLTIDICTVDTIPLTAGGKRRFIVSTLEPASTIDSDGGNRPPGIPRQD